LYEYKDFRNDEIHGEFATLPTFAPPIATEEDKLIKDIIGKDIILPPIDYASNPGTFNLGQCVFIETHGIKYYFVSKRDGVTSSPPNSSDWIADKCSKCIHACKLRWDNTDINVSPLTKGHLPFGGFPGVERLRGNNA
jgi:hypothetical protein